MFWHVLAPCIPKWNPETSKLNQNIQGLIQELYLLCPHVLGRGGPPVDQDGRGLADARTLLRTGQIRTSQPGTNTTIGVVATNARLDQVQATVMAQMAHDGVARAIAPAHTPSDGDAIFALSTGTYDAPVDLATVGALAAETMAEAIVRAVRAATGIPGYPAARDLQAGQ